MRWETLFADLEAAAEATGRAAFDAEVADGARVERAMLTLVDRLRAHDGRALACHLQGGDVLRGPVLDVGADWLLLGPPPGTLLPLGALTGVEGLSRQAAPADGVVARRLGLSVVLRGLARARAPVLVTLPDGTSLTGTLDRVGADHADLAEHPADEPRRAEAVTGVRTLRFAALVSVRAL